MAASMTNIHWKGFKWPLLAQLDFKIADCTGPLINPAAVPAQEKKVDLFVSSSREYHDPKRYSSPGKYPDSVNPRKNLIA
ncbi:hypothetical protein WICPIJ_002289 [Wickerhamomyces pijperi]|uniref:Uncharacterized protein n=1 Tax=Wickerhamomyces pijperi TaxID=599730 RepID=A0A9P8QA36_WICPI|nr:hypothetical protein WICPIJ_002289 [Wickerhamomyces pijperi]